MRKKLVILLLKWVSNKCLCHLQSCQWSELCLADTQVKVTSAKHNGHKISRNWLGVPLFLSFLDLSLLLVNFLRPTWVSQKEN